MARKTQQQRAAPQQRPLNDYGWDWTKADGSPETSQLKIEINGFMAERGTYVHKDAEGRWRLTMGANGEPCGLHRWQHFFNICQMLWGYEGCQFKLDINPWLERMVQAACKHKRLSLAGCAGSGKSQFLALWSVVNFLAAPDRTRILVTSTSLKASRGRVWGAIESCWRHLVAPAGVGKLISSTGEIRYTDPKTGEADSRYGIYLIAGETAKEDVALGKMLGFHAHRVMLLCDEMAALHPGLIEVAESNIAQNPEPSAIYVSNPTSPYDSHGTVSTPIGGWETVNESTMEWQGAKAYVIRLDGEESPNLQYDTPPWPYLMTRDKLAFFKATLGERTMRYFSQVRGMWMTEQGADNLYSAIDIASYNATKPHHWLGEYTKVLGFDPSFTNSGDKSMAVICGVGISNENILTIALLKVVELREDIRNKEVSRSEQIALQLRDLCIAEGVSAKHVNIDATGAGDPFCDVFAMKHQSGFMRTKFGGAASDMPVSELDSTPENEIYDNKVTSLWFAGQPLLRGNQLRNLSPELCKELVARTWEQRGRKIRVTPKEIMRQRLGASPDLADAYFLAVDVARTKLKLTPDAKPGNWKTGRPANKKLRELASIYAA